MNRNRLAMISLACLVAIGVGLWVGACSTMKAQPRHSSFAARRSVNPEDGGTSHGGGGGGGGGWGWPFSGGNEASSGPPAAAPAPPVAKCEILIPGSSPSSPAGTSASSSRTLAGADPRRTADSAPTGESAPGSEASAAPGVQANLPETNPIDDLAKAYAEQARMKSEGRADPTRLGRIQNEITDLRAHLLPGAAPGSTEELWIIARDPGQNRPSGDDQGLGTGAMLARRGEVRPEEREVAIPLEHTDVKAEIAGYIATVHVTQKFHNPYDSKIEAVYVFPLPSNAAVNEFVMTVGDRKIRGIIRERAEAEKIYAEAKSQGYVASLLTQERPNIFTQSVANIEPQKSIDVDITYFHTLAYVDGAYEFVFPMVVGPRYNPSGSKDGVGAVGRGATGASRQSTEVQYLRPGERSGQDISLSVDIDAGVSIEALDSPSHVITQEKPGTGRARVALSPRDSIPNKDFVLRYTVAGQTIKSALMTHRDERGGFFTLMLFPPADLASLERKPVEFVFVLDCSGSMSGTPLDTAKRAMERALKRLGPDDTFNVVRFSDSSSQMGSAPVPATPDNVNRGLRYVSRMNSEGGTEMITGIRAALNFPHDPRRLRIVSFMTDGYIGNEMDIFSEVRRLLGPARVFSFGIGTSVNRYLMEGLARIGNGAVAFVGLDGGGAKEVDLFYDRIAHPAMTDVRVDWGGMQVSEVYPRRLPDLFVGRPVILTGRFTGELPAQIRVRGRAGDENREILMTPAQGDALASHKGIAAVWARTKIADLSDFIPADVSGELARETKDTALSHGLLSAYTSFVAVDSSRVTVGAYGTTVPVAVPVPEGVKYETTVQEK